VSSQISSSSSRNPSSIASSGMLRIDPRQLQNEIARTYGDTYRTFLSYGSDPNFGCTATLPERGSPRGLDIGLNPYRPSRPYLTISNNAMG
jgi:hypothetical protein